MVEFCTICGTSLPKGDLTVKGGDIFTSHELRVMERFTADPIAPVRTPFIAESP